LSKRKTSSSLDQRKGKALYAQQGETTTHQIGYGSVLNISFHYPKENPIGYVKDIADALHYTGALQGIHSS
jgi:hypothetical protein